MPCAEPHGGRLPRPISFLSPHAHALNPPPAQRSAPPAAPPLTSDLTGLTDEAPPVYTAGPDVYQGESTVECGPSRPFQPAPPPLRQQPSGKYREGATASAIAVATAHRCDIPIPSAIERRLVAVPRPPAVRTPAAATADPRPAPAADNACSEFARDFYATTSVPPGGFSDVSGARATADISTAGTCPRALVVAVPAATPVPRRPPRRRPPDAHARPGHPSSALAACSSTPALRVRQVAPPPRPCPAPRPRPVAPPARRAGAGTPPRRRECEHLPRGIPAPARDLPARRRAPRRRAVLAVQRPRDRLVPRVVVAWGACLGRAGGVGGRSGGARYAGTKGRRADGWGMTDAARTAARGEEAGGDVRRRSRTSSHLTLHAPSPAPTSSSFLLHSPPPPGAASKILVAENARRNATRCRRRTERPRRRSPLVARRRRLQAFLPGGFGSRVAALGRLNLKEYLRAEVGAERLGGAREGSVRILSWTPQSILAFHQRRMKLYMYFPHPEKLGGTIIRRTFPEEYSVAAIPG
ncbi:hypothetical protein B0H17DRAFT_1297676, partial [Mycena rosella]